LLRDELAHLPVPTLFLWGEVDRFGRPSIGQDLAATMPDAHFEVLPDTGHLPQVDHPELVAAAINQFLAHAHTS